jgi:hypothetical protein
MESIARNLQKNSSALAEIQLTPYVLIHPEIAGFLAFANAYLMKCVQKIAAAVPIHQLPTDVLNVIFGISRDINDGKIPLTISQVCKSWRTVAISNPCLWTNLRVTLSSNIDFFNLLLTRSQPCPVNFDLFAVVKPTYKRHHHSVSDFCQLLFSALTHHLSRFSRINITVREPTNLARILDLLLRYPVALPLLRQLSIVNELEEPSLGSVPLYQCLLPGGAPRLKIAKLRGIPAFLPFDHQLISLHLTVHYFTAIDFHSVVSECGALETLAIYGEFRTRDQDLPPLILPCLRALQIHNRKPSTISNLLFPISAPRLEKLVVDPSEHSNFTSVFTSQLVEKFPNVKCLALMLDYSVQSKKGLRLATTYFPGVENAILGGLRAWSVPEVLRELDEAGRLRWPKLQTLAYHAPAKLQDSLEFRSLQGHPVRLLRLGPSAILYQGDIHQRVKEIEVVECDAWEELVRS